MSQGPAGPWQSYVPPKYPVEEVQASSVKPGDLIIVNGQWTAVQDVTPYAVGGWADVTPVAVPGWVTFDTALGSVYYHVADTVRVQVA